MLLMSSVYFLLHKKSSKQIINVMIIYSVSWPQNFFYKVGALA